MDDGFVVNDAVKAIRALTDELGWTSTVRAEDDITLVICPLGGDDAFAGALFLLDRDAHRTTLRLTYRASGTPELRPAILEALGRMNADLLVGCFELDEAGEIKFRDTLLSDGTPSDGLLAAFVASALEVATDYASVFPEVVAGRDPAEAVEACELPD
ncbi:MAG: YbjN domain-containing protein [Myxococcota bacterium]